MNRVALLTFSICVLTRSPTLDAAQIASPRKLLNSLFFFLIEQSGAGRV
jgi:hypothetical protein